MKKAFVMIFLLSSVAMAGRAQGYENTTWGEAVTEQSEQVVTFTFRPTDNVLYKAGNEAQLDRLYKLVDRYRTQIASGTMPLYVDGYCASQSTHKANRRTAFIRANRVKSELIVQKGLREENFVTSNHTTPLDGVKDVVVVTLRIPAQVQAPAPASKPEPQPATNPKPTIEPKPTPEPAAEPQPAPASKPEAAQSVRKGHFPYCFAVRTNMLYDALLLPTLGVEWRVAESVGIKLDGGYSRWGDRHGKVQKAWLVNPEVRWYMGTTKRFYLGAGANYSDYNIYKYPARYLLAGSFSDGYGRQGKLWNAGVTAGYQFRLSRGFSLDLNIGGGYSSLDYDSFTVTDGVRVYENKSATKQVWGLTQAGVNLVWTIGGKK